VSKATAYGVGVNWYPWNTVKLSINYEQTEFEGGAATGDRADERALLSRFAINF
jgi:phosphate-selective porin OprO/OprP